MITSTMKVSKEIVGLLNDLNEIQFGEINNVEVLLGPPVEIVSVTKAQKELVLMITRGIQNFKQIKVHQGDPTYLVVEHVTKSGRKGLKQYKLN